MGCNTSKESVPAAEGQDKEKQENGDVNKVEDNNVANSGELSFLCICDFFAEGNCYTVLCLVQTCTGEFPNKNSSIHCGVFPLVIADSSFKEHLHFKSICLAYKFNIRTARLSKQLKITNPKQNILPTVSYHIDKNSKIFTT